ncbi:hypothetical protein AOQ84DRAFT_391737 [Glonium stellatum]|uniref:C2H2-type domain-containing protein n=1 Tax=Glonium stellatum TaxID=574774 RepID=A0A8E2JP25_9PEZI|nr:hypothetical protein AOQ84DRAFT_391737 [Glonium stellatum]
MSNLGYRSDASSLDFPTHPELKLPEVSARNVIWSPPQQTSYHGTHQALSADFGGFLRDPIEDKLHNDLFETQTEIKEIVTWPSVEADLAARKLCLPITEYSSPTNGIPFDWSDGDFSLQTRSSDPNLATLQPSANSTIQLESGESVGWDDLVPTRHTLSFREEDSFNFFQDGPSRMLGLQRPKRSTSFLDNHDSTEDGPAIRSNVDHAADDQISHTSHPGRVIQSRRTGISPTAHTLGLSVGKNALYSTRKRTNAVTGSKKKLTGRQVTAPVKAWFDAHKHNPYASNDEKAALAHSTGLTLKQISDCLSNLRARTLLKGGNASNTRNQTFQYEASLSGGSADGPRMPSRKIGTVSAGDTSVSSPQISELPQSALGDNTQDGEESARGSSHQSNYAISPDFSCSPTILGDFQDISPLDLCRKGKRKFMPTLNLESVETGSLCNDSQIRAGRPFHCTFCLKTWKSHYEWRRHEATHVVAKKWTCMPEDVAINDNRCAFCDLEFPPLAHLGEHNVRICLEKAIPARAFARKDHLKQHIEQVHLLGQDHGFTDPGKILDCWSRDANECELVPGALWCGFCGTSFESWKERVKHVSSHFQKGAKIADWRHKPV